jgi:cytochrome c-type protein NapC
MPDGTQPPATEAQSGKADLLSRLRQPPRCSMLRMLVIGVLFGVVVWGGLNTGMEWTNRSEFCISCHEMTIPYEDLKKTVHFTNRSGTSVACADCHVASSKNPIDYGRKFTMKVLAARDVIGHLSGIVDTPEKFDAHRLEMAKRVWKKMKDADSKECRNCHNFDTMDLSKQKKRSQVKHEEAREDHKTCIDCHKGIAHKPVHQNLEEEGDSAPSGEPKKEG